MTLSVIVIAKNEACWIARCLESVHFADEIIVLDSGSEDNTVDIASRYTPHVYSTDWPGYGVQKQRALLKTTSDWVLNLDADEFVNDDLRTFILNMMSKDDADAYRIPVHLNFYGQKLTYSSSPSRHVRLFKRAGAAFSKDIVHEKIILPPTFIIKQCQLPIYHDSFRDLTHAIEKMNRYSSYSAKIKLSTTSKKPTAFKALAGALWMFFRTYIFQRGFMEGTAGFFLSCYHAQASFYRVMKQIYPDMDDVGLPEVMVYTAEVSCLDSTEEH